MRTHTHTTLHAVVSAWPLIQPVRSCKGRFQALSSCSFACCVVILLKLLGVVFFLPRLRLVRPQTQGSQEPIPEIQLSKGRNKRSDRCCNMCAQVLRTDLHAQNVSPERFRTVQLAFFCVNVCVNFRTHFRQLFACLCFEISDRFRCSDAGLTFYLGLLTNRSEERWQRNCMPLNCSEPFRRHWNPCP